MEIPKTYDPANVEDKWYRYWSENGFFRSLPDHREPYTIVIPPPNVTGVLHMGHMLNNTIQDVLIRRARMLGKNACWVPGTDHASIATEAKVVQMLRERGIKKSDLSREQFLKYAWEWKEKYGGIILEQLKKLGASCDWERTRFTMDPDLSEAVTDTFIDLYRKGYIYRGLRMVNWDPVGLTAVSDEEVIHKEVNSKLYYVRYRIEGSAEEWITIATTRPETILGDTAVCVHPEDERYAHLKGRSVIIPIVNRRVPVIFDDYIDREFGTGALKVTPAHDVNDYAIGLKHKLEVIDTLAPNGTMSEAAGFYIGEDRFAVRKKIAKDLEAAGHMVKVEDIRNKVGFSERTDAVIEPKLSLQWFVNMKGISAQALNAVVSGEVKLVPDKFNNTYRHWMENVQDWCISRQLWWGQRIPAWYDQEGEVYVAKTEAEALKLSGGKKVRQDEDVLDTWFSSWLWPITVFDPKVIGAGKGYQGNADINYYYPTNDLVTAPEILFFWVARMIIAGYEYRGKKPFENVYLTGIVRDKQGRKMSKSLGNSPDPLGLIEKYSADGVRVGMLLCSPAGNDLLFDESYCEQGRNFANKIWNAFRLIKSFSTGGETSDSNRSAMQWFHSRFAEQQHIINDHYRKLRISDALMTTYKLVWDDFCSWYLEMIKPEFKDGKPQPLDRETLDQTIEFFEDLLRLLHPFMPFITEELWSLICERGKDRLIAAPWPVPGEPDRKLLSHISLLQGWAEGIKKEKNKQGLKMREPVILAHKNAEFLLDHRDLALKVTGAEDMVPLEQVVGNVMLNTSGTVAAEAGERNKAEYSLYFSFPNSSKDNSKELLEELAYQQGFLESVNKKLSNEKFVQNAKPDLVATERRKKSDAEARIRAIEEQLGKKP
ncbi:MAG: valine--tRNA ligase [Bacteroidia bacterium]|nr:valine--tRNA ligase [Bacteroidia bacterium]